MKRSLYAGLGWVTWRVGKRWARRRMTSLLRKVPRATPSLVTRVAGRTIRSL